MKPTRHLGVFLFAMGLVLLRPVPFSLAGSADSETTTGAEEVEEEVAEAMRAIRSFSAEQKDDAVAQAKQALKKLDAQIDRMEQQMRDGWSDLDRAARQKSRAALQRLREQRNELAEWYGGMKHGSLDAWERLKEGFLKSYGKLEQAFQEARNELASGGKPRAKQ